MKAREIKERLLEEAYNYQTSIEQEIPLDGEGNIRKEYLNYVSLNSVHKMLEFISRDISSMIIEEPSKNKDFVNVYIESSFYMVTKDTMDHIMKLLTELIDEEVKIISEDIPDDDLNITA